MLRRHSHQNKKARAYLKTERQTKVQHPRHLCEASECAPFDWDPVLHETKNHDPRFCLDNQKRIWPTVFGDFTWQQQPQRRQGRQQWEVLPGRESVPWRRPRTSTDRSSCRRSFATVAVFRPPTRTRTVHRQGRIWCSALVQSGPWKILKTQTQKLFHLPAKIKFKSIKSEFFSIIFCTN